MMLRCHFLPHRIKCLICTIRWQSSFRAVSSHDTDHITKIVSKDDSETIYALDTKDVKLITKNCVKLKERLDLLLLQLYLREKEGIKIPQQTSLETLKKTILCHREGLHGLSDFFIEECKRKEFRTRQDDLNVPQYLRYTSFSLVGQISRNERNRLYSYVGNEGIQFGQSLVVDFSSLQWMQSADRRSVNYNIRRLTMLNGKSRRPFHLHFTRFFENGTVYYLADKLRFLPTHCALTATANCYSQMFVRNRIVYLSPLGTKEVEYNPDDVYVISPSYEPKLHSSASYSSINNLRIATLPLGFKWQYDNKKWISVDEVYQILSLWKNLRFQRQQNIRSIRR